MSVLSRAGAPAAGHELAADVAALLTNLDTSAPAALPIDGARRGPVRLLGPTGLGAAALRIPYETRSAPTSSAIPPLYCPPPGRDDPALAAAVNTGLIEWAAEIG